MNNYRVDLDRGFEKVFIMVRGNSQKDAENFIIEEIKNGNLWKLNFNGKLKVIVKKRSA